MEAPRAAEASCVADNLAVEAVAGPRRLEEGYTAEVEVGAGTADREAAEAAVERTVGGTVGDTVEAAAAVKDVDAEGSAVAVVAAVAVQGNVVRQEAAAHMDHNHLRPHNLPAPWKGDADTAQLHCYRNPLDAHSPQVSCTSDEAAGHAAAEDEGTHASAGIRSAVAAEHR